MRTLALLCVFGPCAFDKGCSRSAILEDLEKRSVFWMHPSLKITSLPGKGRSVVAAKDIPQGELLFKTKLVYDVSRVSNIILNHTWMQTAPVPNECDFVCQRRAIMTLGLSLDVRIEKAHQGSSDWGRYALEFYPRSSEEIGNIVVFDEEMLDDLLVTSAEYRTENLRGCLAYLKTLLEGLGKDVFAEEEPSEEELRLWYGIIQSRSFWSGEHPPTLIGGIDCCINHDDSLAIREKVRSDGKDGTEEVPIIPSMADRLRDAREHRILASRPYVQGDEVYIRYASGSNLELLADYGFVQPPPPILRAQLGVVNIKYPTWTKTSDSGRRVWKMLCKKGDREYMYKSDLQAAYPEEFLLCMRLSKYETASGALEAHRAGWLVVWSPQRQDIWKQGKLAVEDWISSDVKAYEDALQYCNDLQTQVQRVLDKRIQKYADNGESAPSHRRDFVTAVQEEMKLLIQCNEGLRDRLAWLDSLRKCCVREDRVPARRGKGKESEL